MTTTLELPGSLSPEQLRAQAAWAVKTQAHDIIPWPELEWFNSRPCSQHETLDPACNRCGISLRRHQRTGAVWLYLARKGLVSDPTGSGKTPQVLAVLAMCKARGELSPDNRAVVVCKAAAVQQWAEQVRRLLPGIQVLAASGTPQQRLSAYMGGWEVAVVSDRTFSPAGKPNKANARDGDVAILRQFPVGTLVCDDLDALGNTSSRTSWAVNKLAEDCERVMEAHATPLNKHLAKLYGHLRPVGGAQVLGSLQHVKDTYVRQSKTYIRQVAMVCPDGHLTPPPWRKCAWEDPWTNVTCRKPCAPDPTKRKVVRTLLHDSGVNPDTIGEFRRLIAPLVLRRTVADLDDVELPGVQYSPVYLDLLPEQRKRYDELRKGVLTMLKPGGPEITQMKAQQIFLRGQQICSGTASLDGVHGDVSAKLDWVMDRLAGELEEEKTIVFVYFKDNLAALGRRLDREGIGHVKLWGAETDQQERYRRQVRFREDPACRVLLGTSTIEQSLNLQAARYLVMVDTLMSAARFTQLVGRSRRQGSPYPTVYVPHLLARNTQEDGYLPLLRREQGMSDVVWGEKDDVLTALKPRQLLQMVATGTVQP